MRMCLRISLEYAKEWLLKWKNVFSIMNTLMFVRFTISELHNVLFFGYSSLVACIFIDIKKWTAHQCALYKEKIYPIGWLATSATTEWKTEKSNERKRRSKLNNLCLFGLVWFIFYWFRRIAIKNPRFEGVSSFFSRILYGYTLPSDIGRCLCWFYF